MRLPPYGKALVQRHTRPSNGVWVYLGRQAWKHADIAQHHYLDRSPLVLPDGESPGAYRWPVKGLDCMVVLTTEQPPERVRELGVELILAGALRAVVVGEIDNLKDEGITIFRPGGKE